MTRWHTDKPIRRLRGVRAIPPIRPVLMFRASPIAGVAMADARAFYRQKLRLWAREHGRQDEPTEDQ